MATDRLLGPFETLFDRFALRKAARQCRYFNPVSGFIRVGWMNENCVGISFHTLVISPLGGGPNNEPTFRLRHGVLLSICPAPHYHIAALRRNRGKTRLQPSVPLFLLARIFTDRLNVIQKFVAEMPGFDMTARPKSGRSSREG
jgi:hypothetical protein